MRRPEGWRSNRRAGMPIPTYDTAVPVTEPTTPDSAASSRRRATAVWRYLVSVRSRLSSVEWSLTFVGVLAYLFVTVTYRVPGGDVAMGAALFGLLLLPGGFRVSTSAVLLGALLLWALVGAVFSPWTSIVLESCLDLAKVWLVYFAIVNAIRTRSQIWFFMVWFLALYGSHPIRGAVVNYLTGNTYFGRAAWYQGIFSNPNDLAALTLLQISMAAALAVTERRGIVKVGAVFALVIMPFTILVTQSRGALVASGVFLLMTIWFHPKKARILGAMAVVGALLVAIAPQGVWDRLEGLRFATDTETLGSVDEEGSAEQRWQIWETGMRVAKSNPVTGVGLGGFRYSVGTASAALGNRDAHSTYLTLAAENGIPGLLLFLLLVGATLARSRHVRLKLQTFVPHGALQLRFLELGLIAFLIAGIWGSYSKLAFLYVHLALMWALSAACEREAAEARRMVLVPPPRTRG